MSGLTVGALIDLSLGRTEGRKVDFAIPQDVFNQMTPTARANIAGWYYAPEARAFGRLLTQDECWTALQARIYAGTVRVRWNLPTLRDGEALEPHLAEYLMKRWPCFRAHVERGELLLEEPEAAA